MLIAVNSYYVLKLFRCDDDDMNTAPELSL